MICQRSGNCCYTMPVQIMGERNGKLRVLYKPGGKLCPHLSYDGPKASCAVHARPEFRFSPCWIYGNPDVDTDFEPMRGRPCGVGAMFQRRGGLPIVDPRRMQDTIKLEGLEDLGPWKDVKETARFYE